MAEYMHALFPKYVAMCLEWHKTELFISRVLRLWISQAASADYSSKSFARQRTCSMTTDPTILHIFDVLVENAYPPR